MRQHFRKAAVPGRAFHPSSSTSTPIATARGGLIETVAGHSELSGVTFAGGSDLEVGWGTTLTLDDGTTTHKGTLIVDAHARLNIDQATLTKDHIIDAGVVNFGAGDTLSPSDVLTFVGAARVNVEQSSSFDITVDGMRAGDVIDLRDVNFDSKSFHEKYNDKTGKLTVSDGTHTATFTLVDLDRKLKFASDGHGGTLILDQPKRASVMASEDDGGDQFKFNFHKNASADTGGHANWHYEGTERGHMPPGLSSAPADTQDWLAEAGQHDFTAMNPTPQQWQAHLHHADLH